MPYRQLSFAILLLCLLPLTNCHLGNSLPTDQQTLKLFFKYGFRNEVDTFNGTLTKDLVMKGVVTVPFLFTASQQDSILSALTESNFFNLPDTLYPVPNIDVEPNAGPQILRVEHLSRVKSLLWSDLLDKSDPRSEAVLRLWRKLQQIVESTDTYRHLPPAVGYYI